MNEKASEKAEEEHKLLEFISFGEILELYCKTRHIVGQNVKDDGVRIFISYQLTANSILQC